MTTHTDLKTLSDDALLTATQRLVANGRQVDAALVLHLAEVDARRLYLRIALPSLFAYCQHLGLSEDAAFNRIEVARLARRLPAAIDALQDGRVHLTGLRLLAPHLTSENHAAVLAAAAHQSKREIEELIAQLAPKPPVPDSIRKLPTPRNPAARTGADAATPSTSARLSCTALPASGPQAAAPGAPSAPLVAPDAAQTDAPAAPLSGAARRSSTKPLDEASFKVQFTASRALRDKLLRLQSLLAHTDDADLAGVVERAADLLLERLENRRFGLTARPRSKQKPTQEVCAPTPRPAAPTTRHIPSAVKRAVYERDGGQCAFIDEASGRRCPETLGLEFDHIEGFARSRKHSVDGIRLICRSHNQYAAQQLYGVEFMAQARRRHVPVPPVPAPGGDAGFTTCSGATPPEREASASSSPAAPRTRPNDRSGAAVNQAPGPLFSAPAAPVEDSFVTCSGTTPAKAGPS